MLVVFQVKVFKIFNLSFIYPVQSFIYYLAFTATLKIFFYYPTFISIFFLETSADDVKVHKDCRISFRNRIKRKEELKRKIDVTSEKEQEKQVVEGESRRSSIRDTISTEKKCFICNIKLYCDSQTFNKGGLGRCEPQKSKEKLLQALSLKINQTNSTKQLVGSISFLVVMLLEIFLQWMSFTTRNVILASHTHTSLKNLSPKTMT